jgi:hypothetical protein
MAGLRPRNVTDDDLPNASGPFLKQAPLGQRKGWYKSGVGYVHLWEPSYPNASKTRYVAEHTKVTAEILGRPLFRSEELHHRNRRRDDNRPEHLELWVRKPAAGSGESPSDDVQAAAPDDPLLREPQTIPPLDREITRR